MMYSADSSRSVTMAAMTRPGDRLVRALEQSAALTVLEGIWRTATGRSEPAQQAAPADETSEADDE